MTWGGGSRRRRAAIACAAAFAILSRATGARAQDAPEPFTVDYAAPDGCPDSSAFFGEVTARTPRARAATAGEKARVLHVRVEKRGEAHVGKLSIEEAGATSTAREVRGGSCGEVVGALGLVAALAVDPRASVAPRPAPAAAAAAAAGSPASSAPATTPEEKAAPEKDPANSPPKDDAKDPAPPKTDADRPSTSSPSTPQRNEPSRWTIGAGGEVAALSNAVVALRIFGELDVGGRLFAPSIRIAATRTIPVDRAAPIGSAALTWTTGGVEISPLRLDLASTIVARPCAGVAVGVLDAAGAGIATPRSETRAWFAATVHGRLVWAVAPALAIELEGGAILPILRESFFFDPNILVYRAPAISGFGRLGLGVRFP